MWPRTTSSLIRAVFLQFLTLFVFISLQSFNPLHPLTWVSTSIGLLITPSSWFYDLIAVVTVTGIGLFYSTQVSLFPWIPKNPVANFTRCFLPQVSFNFLNVVWFYKKLGSTLGTHRTTQCTLGEPFRVGIFFIPKECLITFVSKIFRFDEL